MQLLPSGVNSSQPEARRVGANSETFLVCLTAPNNVPIKMLHHNLAIQHFDDLVDAVAHTTKVFA